MARPPHKFHYTYKITNIKNGKYYIGMHSTSDLNDGYMGGGKRITNSIRKHGKENHKKEILEYLESRELLAAREKEIVNEELLNDPMCMNLCKGGHYYDRGWTNEDRSKALEKIKKLMKDPIWMKDHSKKISESLKNSKNKGHLISFLDKKHSEESKRKIGLSNKESQKGSRNSQFNTCWIKNEEQKLNKKIRKEELDYYESLGWERGMKNNYRYL